MKRAIGLFLVSVLALSAFGCDGGDGDTATGGGGSGGSSGGSGGTGGGTGGGGTGGGSGGTGGGMSSLSCADYCGTIQTNCKDANQQYTDEASCMAVCATFPIGTEADKDGNTLGCRTYHAGAAASGAGTHCPHAGPLGGGACGTDECDNFCEIAVAVCGDQMPPPYADKGACMTACMGFVDTMTTPYNTAATAGDTLACRMYHLTVASVDDASKDAHCPHIVEASPVCVNP